MLTPLPYFANIGLSSESSEDVLAEGMEIDAVVLEVSRTRRISISIRDVEPINPVQPSTPKRETPVQEDEENDELYR